MTVTCPHCGLSRAVAAEAIPPDTLRATCPGCGQAFAFRPPQDVLARRAAHLPKAGFWPRAAAASVDSLAVMLVQMAFGALLGLAGAASGAALSDDGQLMIGGLSWFLGTLAGIVYYVFFTGYCGQTPGKMVLGVKVVRADGADLGYGRTFAREVPAKFVSGLILGIGYLMAAFDPQKQGLHDKMTGTYVIKL